MSAFAIAFTTWTLGAFETDVRSAVTASQLALARSAAGDIDMRIEERRALLVGVATMLGGSPPAPGAGTHDFFAAYPFVTKSFDRLRMLDAEGRLVHDSSGATDVVEPPTAEREAAAQALAGVPFTVSATMPSPETGEAAIVFAAALRTPDGKSIGALLGRVRLGRPDFLGRPGAYRIGREGYVTALENRDNPIFVLHGKPDRILKPAADAKTDPSLAPVFTGQEGSLRRTNSRGVETLNAFVRLRSMPWVLLTVYPTSEAFAQVRSRQHEVLTVGLALCGLAGALAWWLSGRLLQPLSELRAVLERRDDEPGPAVALRAAGSREIAAVVAAYNAQSARRRDFEERLAASERRMAAVTNNIPAFIAHLDTEQRCTFVNRQAASMFGGDAATATGRLLREVLGDEVHGQMAPEVAKALAGEATAFETAGLAHGRAYRYQWRLVPDVAPFAHVRGFYAMAFDITSLDEARARQLQVEQQLRAITDSLPALISYVDRDERYVFLNATFQTWLGIDPARAIGGLATRLTESTDHQAHLFKLRRCLRGERLSGETDVQTLHGRKTLHTELIPDIGPDGTVVGAYALSSDVTALRDAEREMSRLVRSDALTGLANRYQFNEALPLALARCARSRQALALMFLDIDHFKQINDTLGHAGGDAALKEIARRLQASVRGTDLVARLAGDEFVVILEGVRNASEPEQVARKVLDAVEQPFDIEGQRLDVTVSVGIAYRALADISAPEILARADRALYAAKNAGRNSYRMTVTG